MKFIVLSVLLSFFVANSAVARKPAVEEFVGIETEHFDKTPQGTEVIFEFGNMVQVKNVEIQSTNGTNFVAPLMIVGFLFLPFLMWFGITRKTKSVVKTEESHSQHDNITKLDDFRSTESHEEEVKKAS